MSKFLYHGVDGVYLFNYDCHRLKNASWEYGGNLQDYTPQEVAFLKHALDPATVRDHDKQYLISQDTMRRMAEDGGNRPLMCRLPVGDSKTFTLTIGDDLARADQDRRIRSSQLVVTFKAQKLSFHTDQLNFEVNGRAQTPEQYQIELRKPDLIEIILANPPMRRGANTITLGLKPGSDTDKIIRSIDLNIDYLSPDA